MAEFQEIMRQAKRMCDAQAHCSGCPAIKTCFAGLKNMEVDDDRCCEFERVVMQWAEEHPEPRELSWAAAWELLFPDAHMCKPPCPKYFVRTDQYEEMCDEHDNCYECKNEPILDDVAKKLGLRPIGGVIDEE